MREKDRLPEAEYGRRWKEKNRALALKVLRCVAREKIDEKARKEIGVSQK